MSFILGLTGGIATGKSSVATIFRFFHIPVVDGDVIARKLQEKGTPTLKKLVENFGKEILLENEELNRAKLGEIVFSNEEKMSELNQIMDPFLRQGFQEEIDFYQQQNAPLIVVDNPLLFERNYVKMVHQSMLVYTNEEESLKRLMKRNNLSKKEAQKRIDAQWSIENKRVLADIIIDNSGTVENTKEQVINWLNKGGFI
ncbi:MAG: dephospho-CoA kinase [Streptococcaceae bacterium]|jgi:dephospho-CoA kinase|nr:dephospho-CoA kinase [Streptococcaceae bacterium]